MTAKRGQERREHQERDRDKMSMKADVTEL